MPRLAVVQPSAFARLLVFQFNEKHLGPLDASFLGTQRVHQWGTFSKSTSWLCPFVLILKKSLKLSVTWEEILAGHFLEYRRKLNKKQVDLSVKSCDLPSENCWHGDRHVFHLANEEHLWLRWLEMFLANAAWWACRLAGWKLTATSLSFTLHPGEVSFWTKAPRTRIWPWVSASECSPKREQGVGRAWRVQVGPPGHFSWAHFPSSKCILYQEALSYLTGTFARLAWLSPPSPGRMCSQVPIAFSWSFKDASVAPDTSGRDCQGMRAWMAGCRERTDLVALFGPLFCLWFLFIFSDRRVHCETQEWSRAGKAFISAVEAEAGWSEFKARDPWAFFWLVFSVLLREKWIGIFSLLQKNSQHLTVLAI